MSSAQTPFQKIVANKWSYTIVFLLIFLVTFLGLRAVHAVPAMFALGPAPSIGSNIPLVNGATAEGELPVRIEIPAVGVSASVSNPNTTNIDALDRELLVGAVRYPGTGKLGQAGNVLIFGHSSHLPIVHNQAYKTFNDIQNLKKGDPITVYGRDKVYTYVVESVQLENTSTGEIPLDVSGSKLTLATCDNFGTKADRFVVTATLSSVDTLDGGV